MEVKSRINKKKSYLLQLSGTLYFGVTGKSAKEDIIKHGIKHPPTYLCMSLQCRFFDPDIPRLRPKIAQNIKRKKGNVVFEVVNFGYSSTFEHLFWFGSYLFNEILHVRILLVIYVIILVHNYLLIGNYIIKY